MKRNYPFTTHYSRFTIAFLVTLALFSILSQYATGQECSIGEVTADVQPCNEQGMFFVLLDFDYMNVGDEGFQVTGNGNNYGTFGYDQLPVEIGPLEGDGTTIYEFVVTDLVYTGCHNWTAIDPVDCGMGDCNIWDVTAVPTPCNDDGYFYVILDFEYENVGELGFEVHGNGTDYGTFYYEDLPIELGPLEGDGTTVYEFVASDVAHPDCSDWTAIDPVDCNSTVCEIWDVSAVPQPCQEDGTFYVEISFFYQNTGSLGFHVQGNGTNYGNFEYGDIPVLVGPLEGDGTTVYEFGVIDNEFPDCHNWTEIDPVDCGGGGGDCHIWELVVDDHPCVEGYFYVYLNFNYENVGDEGFNLSVNDEFMGAYTYDQLPLWEVGPFAGDGTTIYHFHVSDIVYGDCGTNREFGPIDCGGGGNCEIGNLLLEALPCEEGQFNAVMDFDYANVGDQGFKVWINEDLIGQFWYEELPVTLGPLDGDGSTVYHFLVRDVAHMDCASDGNLGPVDCGGAGDCQIWDLVPTILPCNDDGMFMVLLNFEYENVGDDGFSVYINEENYGSFAYEEVPVEVGPLDGDGTTVYHITVRDNQHELCHDGTAFSVDCGTNMPLFANLTAEITSCNNGQYYIQINFDPQYQGSGGFIVSGNMGGQGTYAYESLPLQLGPFTTDGSTAYYFILQDAENGLAGNWERLVPFTCESLGMDEIRLSSSLTVYPNPSSGVVSFMNNSKHGVRLQVTNIYGTVVGEDTFIPAGQVIQLNDLRPGIYLYRTTTGAHESIGKFVVY